MPFWKRKKSPNRDAISAPPPTPPEDPEVFFFRVVDEALPEPPHFDQEHLAEPLRARLEKLTPEGLSAFATGYGCSSSGPTPGICGPCQRPSAAAATTRSWTFRDWLLCQGREIFDDALADPDSLAAVLAHDPDPHPFFEAVFTEALEDVDLGLLNAVIDELNPPNQRGLPPDPAGERWTQEDEVKALVPTVWQRFRE